MSFATRLRELREEKGLSREDLSQLCGLGRGTVRDYEQGRREPTLGSAFRLADALGVSVEEFRNGVEDGGADKPARASNTAPGPRAASKATEEQAGEKKPAKGQGRKRKGS
jgi:transcriptional regulator with XRE-family HTH domain